MKTLVIINEPFADMVLGRNTTLAYVLAAAQRGDDVYIYNVDPSGKLPAGEVQAIHITKENAAKLIAKYQEENSKINKTAERFKVGKFCEDNQVSLPAQTVKLSEVDFAIQRLEPMKAPFPPAGKTNVNEYLEKLKAIFPPYFTLNCPISLGDKDFPLEVDKITGKKIATPTRISDLEDDDMAKKIAEMCAEYRNLFSKSGKRKVVLKPDDSAQALGVFSLDFQDQGLDLKTLKEMTIEDLYEFQTYTIKSGLAPDEINQIVNILCYVQYCKDKKINGKVAEISAEQIKEGASMLYGNKVLIQPFLEGIKTGDIRINIAKDKDGNFAIAGGTFRNSASHDEKNFTTCLTTGGSVPRLIEECATREEQENLRKILKDVLNVLNGELREKYKNSMEIGFDFILVGNAKDVCLGEANHHCPALAPISEFLQGEFNQQVRGKVFNLPSQGGLAVIGAIIDQQKELQNKRATQPAAVFAIQDGYGLKQEARVAEV